MASPTKIGVILFLDIKIVFLTLSKSSGGIQGLSQIEKVYMNENVKEQKVFFLRHLDVIPITEVWPGKAQPAYGRKQVVVGIAQ